jgi:HK97 family phage prohead protease
VSEEIAQKPWTVVEDDRCPASRPYGVVREGGALEGCHETEEMAQRQRAALYASENESQGASTDMQHKSFEVAEVKAEGEAGEFSALASVFGNVDHVGDRVLPGAFKNTLDELRASGKALPIIWSHDHSNPMSYIGQADPRGVLETERGLLVQGRLDINDGNPVADQFHTLMKNRLITAWSFGYTVPKGGQKRAKDGVNEIKEVQLFEAGPTLRGANALAQTEAIKSLAPEAAELKAAEVDLEPDRLVSEDEMKRAEAIAFIKKLPENEREELLAPFREDQARREFKIRTRGIDLEETAIEEAHDEDPSQGKSQAQDPLRQDQAWREFEIRTRGIDLSLPKEEVKPEPPKVTASMAELRRQSYDLILETLIGRRSEK